MKGVGGSRWQRLHRVRWNGSTGALRQGVVWVRRRNRKQCEGFGAGARNKQKSIDSLMPANCLRNSYRVDAPDGRNFSEDTYVSFPTRKRGFGSPFDEPLYRFQECLANLRKRHQGRTLEHFRDPP